MTSPGRHSIVQFINRLDSTDGGPARNASELNAHLNELFDEEVPLVTVLRPRRMGDVVSAQTESGVHSRPVITGSTATVMATLRRALHLVKYAREADVVIIHGYYLWWVPAVAAICARSGGSVVLTPHGSLTPHQRAVGRFRKLLWARSAGWLTNRCLKLVITGSDRERSELVDLLSPVPVRCGGVGTMRPSQRPTRRIDQSFVSLLSLGRLAKKKRVDLSIEATRILLGRGFRCELRVYGDGPELASLQGQAKSAGIEKSVVFYGHVNDPASKRDALAHSDILLFPSDDENFGIALVEALAHGVPAVTSAHVAAADGLEPGAVRITPQTGEAIADAVTKLTDEYESASTAAFDTALRFSWPHVASAWIAAIEEVVGTPIRGRIR